METKKQKTLTRSVKSLVNALTTILVSYSLLLKGIRLLKQERLNTGDIVMDTLKDIEPHFYISSAGLLMMHTFGKEGTEIRDAADKCVIDMVKAELAMNGIHKEMI